MSNAFLDTYRPFTGLGMSSLVLGTVGLMLFFLPILGIPISVLGLFFGLVGFGVGLFRPRVSLRWSLGGIGMSALALLLNIGIAVVLVIMALAWRGRYSPAYYSPVDVTGLYWHFVDVVWIFLLPMLYLVGTHGWGDFHF